MIGLMILNGDFDFFHIVDDMDCQRADVIFHSTFLVDGNHTGRTPCNDVIAAFTAWRNDNV
jgi:hypothetical protein